MIKLEPIDLEVCFPADGLGAVVMQPFVTSDVDAPQCWPGPEAAQQLERIRRVLSLAESHDHGAAHTHFTVFPEYSIPGLEGVELIQSELQRDAWPSNSVVIAGLSGLDPGEYEELSNSSCTTSHILENSPVAVQRNQWVNCCVIWAKSPQTGQRPTVRRYVQPKLRASALEGLLPEEHMFCGQGMYLFKAQVERGRPLFFACVLCYDWIARHDYEGDTGVLALVSRMNETARTNNPDVPQPLDLVFLLERNPKPNYPDFLDHTRSFFTKHLSFLDRDRSMVVVANTAGCRGPGHCREYGFSGIICHPNAPFEHAGRDGKAVAPHSFAVSTTRLRQRDNLHTCKEALFRENGECVHSFKFYPPATVEGVSGDPRHPLYPLNVHSLDGDTSDTRLTGGQVPAIVKWVNDEIDEHELPPWVDASLKPCLQTALNSVVAKIRGLPSNTLGHLVQLGTSTLDPSVTCVDEYGSDPIEALRYLVRLVSTFASVGAVSLENTRSHAKALVADKAIEVTSVYGSSTPQNLTHAENVLGSNPRLRRVVFSHATDGSHILERDRRFTKAKPPFYRVDYGEFNQLVQSAQSPAELAMALTDFVTKAWEQTDDRIC